jgi:hypothetical protein
MISPFRLFVTLVVRLLAPLNMMSDGDAGSSFASTGGGSKKQDPPEEMGHLDNLWKGFLDAAVEAEHAKLRAIAHAGRLDILRKTIYQDYTEAPTACADVELAINCKSQEKFLAYTLREDLIPAKGLGKAHWKTQVNVFNKLVPKCKEFDAWQSDHPEAFLTDEYIERFVQANIECTTWTKIHAKCNKPSVDAKEATKFLTAGKSDGKTKKTESDTKAKASSSRPTRKTTNTGSLKEKSDDENEDDVEEDEPTGAAEEKEDKNPELTKFLKQVKDKKGKIDVFNMISALQEQLEVAAKQAVQAYEEKIETLEDEVQTLRNINNAVQQKWNNAKRQKLADKEGISVNEIQDTAVNYTGATQEIMDWDEE